MRYLFAAAAVIGLLSFPALTTVVHADSMKNCAATWKEMPSASKAKTTYKKFSSECMKGGAASTPKAAAAPATLAKTKKPEKTSAMMAPRQGTKPAGATGQCKDGSYTMAKTHSGACSRHGGVAKWL